MEYKSKMAQNSYDELTEHLDRSVADLVSLCDKLPPLERIDQLVMIVSHDIGARSVIMETAAKIDIGMAGASISLKAMFEGGINDG
jgi:hypothetical protein